MRHPSPRCHDCLKEPSPDLPGGRVHADFEEVLQERDLVARLSSLSTSHREVLLHLYVFSHTQVETARALGIPTGTVKFHAHHVNSAIRLCAWTTSESGRPAGLSGVHCGRVD